MIKTNEPLVSKKEVIYTKLKLVPIMGKFVNGFNGISKSFTNKSLGVFVFVFLFFLLINCLPTFAITMRGGDIFFVRPSSPWIDGNYVPPEFLSVDDLVFYTCIEEKNIPVKSTVICLDDNSFKDIELVRWFDNKNCYIGSFNLAEKDCRQMLVQSEYMKDDEVVTLQQEIRVNRLSSIMDLVSQNQYSDGGWKNSVETASGMWVLSHYRDIYDDEIKMASDWLKMYRNNDDKCWPKDDCSVRTTAKIMAYLTLSDHNDSYRIVHDGLVFLENMHNYYQEDDKWNLSVKPFEPGNTSCIISYEKNLLNNYSFSMLEDEVVYYTINPVPNQQLMVICDQNFAANLSAGINDYAFIYEGDNLSYNMPNNCWSNDHKWGECDILTTLFATMTNISEEHKEVAMDYLRGEIKTLRSGEEYLGTNQSVEMTSLFVYLENNSDMISWLRYKQNNEGSWGNGTQMDKIIPTGYALLGLLNSGFNRTNEVIEDAETWVNDKELEFILNITDDYQAWNSTEKNALAFVVLKNNAKPVIKANPMIVFIDKESVDVEIFNPTTFKLNEVSLEFSDNLKDVLEIEDEDYIPPYSYIKQTIKKKKAETGNVFGYLYVYNYDDEIGKIPIMITNFPKIEIKSQNEDLIVFGTKISTTFNIIKTGHTFDCKLTWDDDDITSKEDYKITTNSQVVDLTFKSAERIEKTYTGNFNCVSGDYDFEIPVSIRVSRYESFPFTVTPSDIIINKTRQLSSFIIENKLDETLDLNVRFLKNSPDFELSRSSVSIDPNNKVNISIYNNVLDGINVSQTNMIEVSALGQKKEINFRVSIIAENKSQLSPLVLWIIIVLILTVIGVSGFITYKYKDRIIKLIKGEKKVDLIKVKIKKLEEKEKRTAIMNMVNIMRILKKDDTQIRARLKDEGFTDDEVNAAFESENADDKEEDADDDND